MPAKALVPVESASTAFTGFGAIGPSYKGGFEWVLQERAMPAEARVAVEAFPCTDRFRRNGCRDA